MTLVAMGTKIGLFSHKIVYNLAVVLGPHWDLEGRVRICQIYSSNQCIWTIFPKCTNKNQQKRHGLGHVTHIKFGTPSNISLKRIKLQTRNLAQECIRTISPKWPIKISVKGCGLGHVTPIKSGTPTTILVKPGDCP